LLLQRVHAGIDSGTKHLLRNVSKTGHLLVSTGETGANGRCKILKTE
jgi:hypothetical protein